MIKILSVREVEGIVIEVKVVANGILFDFGRTKQFGITELARGRYGTSRQTGDEYSVAKRVYAKVVKQVHAIFARQKKRK